MIAMPPRFKALGDIRMINGLSAAESSSAYSVALRLLETGFQSMAVLDVSGRVIGKVTEMDLLKALVDGQDLREVRVGEIMAPTPPVVNPDTLLETAVGIMEENRLLRLPVVNKERFIGSVTRHDLLRAWLGLWIDEERGSRAPLVIG
jgi:CBS domain-containing protein